MNTQHVTPKDATQLAKFCKLVTLLPSTKINISKFLGPSRLKADYRTVLITDFTKLVLFHPNSVVFPKSTNMAPPGPLCPAGMQYIWYICKGAKKYHHNIGRLLPTPYQKQLAFCGTNKVFKTAVREMHGVLQG